MAILPVDLVLRGGRIYTLDPYGSRVSAVAVLAGRVVCVGTDREISSLIGRNTEVVNLEGATVLPGFNEAHTHIISFAVGLEQVDVKSPPVACVNDIVKLIGHRAYREPAGKWVIGRGYDQNKLAERRHPTRWDLDVVSPENPVFLGHTSGHMATVNSLALTTAGIGRDTPDPQGGRIVRDRDGEATGLLLEKAQTLVGDAIPTKSPSDVRRSLRQAADQYLSEGITTVQDAGTGFLCEDELGIWQTAVEAGDFPLRTILMIREGLLTDAGESGVTPPQFGLSLGMRTRFGDERLKIGALKMFADGSLIGRTARVTVPYKGEPHNLGMYVCNLDRLRESVNRAHAQGWQIAIHAIGDQAIDVSLDYLEEALRQHPRKDHRHRIEHCGMVNNALLNRMSRLLIIPVPQQRFISELGDGFLANLGRERAQMTYPLKSYLDHSLVVPGSSDRPVVDGAPLRGIEAAVNQKTLSGADYAPDQRVSVERAIRMWCVDSAYAAFEENIKGTLEPGKLADMVVLEDDPHKHSHRIGSIAVLKTIVGGKVLYDA